MKIQNINNTLSGGISLHLCLLLILLLSSCATNTRVDMTWMSDDFAESSVNKILIIGMSQDEAIRRAFEEALQASLEEAGVEAISSLQGISFNQEISRPVLERAFSGQNIDAVIVSRLVGVDEETRYVPGRVVEPYIFYSDFYGYYDVIYREVYEPGYLVNDTVVNVETNIYETEGSSLVWSAISETMNPDSAADAIASISNALTNELVNAGVLNQ